jgi:hypothetical protein
MIVTNKTLKKVFKLFLVVKLKKIENNIYFSQKQKKL